MDLFGVKLVGLTTENLHKLLLTVLFVAVILLARRIALSIVDALSRRRANQRTVFWTRQISAVVTATLIVLSLVSIWFDNPARFATAFGLVTAGLAFALQKVVTSLAGYLVIVRGNTFSVGERITMGGVRGDVVSLGFIQTRILEMGEPPSVQSADPAMWVRARQFTGRIVTVTNDKVFDTPIYNYTRDFPFIWEEMRVPIAYGPNRQRAERILMECAGRVTEDVKALSGAGAGAVAREVLRRDRGLDAEGFLPPDRQLAGTDRPLHRVGARDPRCEGRNEPRHSRRVLGCRDRDRERDVRCSRVPTNPLRPRDARRHQQGPRGSSTRVVEPTDG